VKSDHKWARRLVFAGLCAALALPLPAWAQKHNQPARHEVPRPPQHQQQEHEGRGGAPPHEAYSQPPSHSTAQPHEIPRPPQSYAGSERGGAVPHEVPRPPQHHAGDWLRSHRDLSPQEQERALQNDPQFRSLPLQQQERLRNRLQHFNSLPQQQQQRTLNRMETWEHLTPEQKQNARQLSSQMQQLPPQRRQMMQTAIRDLREMPPDQREQVLDSPRFRNMFSDQERGILKGITRLPLAPMESENGVPHP
jgi:uncharacterized protein DUF3106